MKRDDARKRIDEGLEKLATALSEGRSEELEAFLKIASRFHRYSFGNLLLILMQKPDASHVAGFRRWKELGRFVKKGEAGIGILAPMRYRASDDSDQDGEESREIRGFKVVHVFDVSQTEGEELPEFTAVHGEPGAYLQRLEAVIRGHDIELVEEALPPGTYGLSSGGKITVRAGLSAAERCSVLAHELSHEFLHKGARKHETTKTVRECEAEAVAAVVLSALGMDSSTRSADYIQLYRGDTETLAESLEFIQKTALYILEQIEEVDCDVPECAPETASPAACNHRLYCDDADSSWTTVEEENGTRIECAVCGRFYGNQPVAAGTPNLPEPEDEVCDEEQEPGMRIGRADYEQRRQDRIERYEERATKARQEAEATYSQAKSMADVIPFGQPILVGHHSEKRDRNYRERIHNKFGKSFELQDKSKHYESRASCAEANHAISSDDPQALERLQEKLELLQASQAEMKAINAAWRKAKKPKPDDSDGWEKVADALPEVSAGSHRMAGTLATVRKNMGQSWHIYDVPFPPYALSNNNANMRRVKERIAELQREGQVTESTEVDRVICTVRENTEINRIQLVFPGKPPEEVCAVLKQHGFRWSRRERAWQRLLNDAGRRATDWALSQIEKENV